MINNLLQFKYSLTLLIILQHLTSIYSMALNSKKSLLINSETFSSLLSKKSLIKRVPRRTWTFFYYDDGERECGNYCIITFSIMGAILLAIILCGIWACYSAKKRSSERISTSSLFSQASFYSLFKRKSKQSHRTGPYSMSDVYATSP